MLLAGVGRCRRGFFWCVVAVGGRRSPLAGMRRCRRARGAVGAAFSSTGTSLADVESCWWAQVAVCGRRSAVGAAFSDAGLGWWAQVAVCTAFPARGAYCERWALSARLSGSGNIVGGRGELLVVVGRCWWAQVAACGMRRCLRTLVAVCAAFSGARERRPVLRTPPPFRAAHGACRSACPLAARPHPPVVVRASPPARWPHAPRPSAAPRAASPLDIPPQRCYYNIAFRGGMAVCGASDWVWRSLVACLNGVQEAGGSNPLTQTTASEQSPLCSDVFFASGRCICRKKAAVAPLPCSSFSAKGPARLACSLASALTTARCRYQPFAAAAPRGAGDGPGRARRTEKTRRRSRQYGVRPSEKPPRRHKPRIACSGFSFCFIPSPFPPPAR